MKKMLFVLSILLVSATLTHAQQVVGRVSFDVIIGNRQPAPNEVQLMRVEEDRHPNITKSMHDVENALNHLHNAPDDFGGHKAQAEADLKQAWISLRKALYFRIYEDRR
ncbi:MAG TPA: hypothetical protein VMH01_08510 [Puia sp.]|nr:hypothetical protein [Puia sp.]